MSMLRNTLTTALFALGAITAAHAGNAHEPVLKSMETLIQAQSQGFKGLDAAKIKALRQDFSSKAQTAKGMAKSEYGQLSAGKKPEEIDKQMLANAKQSGTPADVMTLVQTMGGPSKMMQQTDSIVDEFVTDVLSGSQKHAQRPLAETILTALVMASPAHAGYLKYKSCMAAVFVLSVGQGTDAAHKLCNRYS